MVARRHVFYLAGFDPIDAAAQHRRFRRESEKFSRVWNVKTIVSDLGAGAPSGSWQVAASGPNWSTQTTVELLDWQDIVREEIARPVLFHVVQGMVTLGDFVFSGTARRYFEMFWPYGIFFAVPFLNVIAYAALSILAGVLAAWYVAENIVVEVAIFIFIAIGLFTALFRWPGERWHVRRALADWNFARAFMYGRRPRTESRLDEFAQRLIAVTRELGCDEIVIVGHSLGATMAVLALSRAIETDAGFLKHVPKVRLLTVGSTIGKLALHPAASQLRACTRKISAASGLEWTEYQARRDSISFFRLDPVTLKNFKGDMSGDKPFIRLIGIKDMMMPESFERNRFRHMRLHYQFVMGNEKRALYDFFMFVCGPADFVLLSRTQGGADALFAPDGSFLPEQAQGRAGTGP